MPVKNSLKKYRENSYYHVYNRGNNKRTLFAEREDYARFIDLFYLYLTRPLDRFCLRKTFCDDIKLLAFCLMPNHFHLLLHQKSSRGLPDFMKRLQLSYSLYIHKKKAKRGPLYEGRYKARLVKGENDLLNVSRYIHTNPSELTEDVLHYPYSSFKVYADPLREDKSGFLSTIEILSYFDCSKDLYRRYVLEGLSSPRTVPEL
jgi:putative transposase